MKIYLFLFATTILCGCATQMNGGGTFHIKEYAINEYGGPDNLNVVIGPWSEEKEICSRINIVKYRYAGRITIIPDKEVTFYASDCDNAIQNNWFDVSETMKTGELKKGFQIFEDILARHNSGKRIFAHDMMEDGVDFDETGIFKQTEKAREVLKKSSNDWILLSLYEAKYWGNCDYEYRVSFVSRSEPTLVYFAWINKEDSDYYFSGAAIAHLNEQ